MNMTGRVLYLFLELLIYTAVVSGSTSSLKFLALGDGGGIHFHPFTTAVQTSVANAMGEVAKRENTSFNLLLGDNFYLYGVRSVDDPRFEASFEKVYDAPSLQTPFYVIAGNHDYYGNVSAQIMYSQRSKRWNFPDYYHKMTHFVPGGKHVDILMLDTMMLCGNVYSYDQPTGPTNKAEAEKQWKWLEDNLNASSADYILVVGHYPVWSVSMHGSTNCLIARLEPLLYKYKVAAYMAGHDHNLQHIVKQKDGHTVHHLGIGCANFVDPSQVNSANITKEEMKFFWAELMYLGGFAYFDVSNTGIKFEYIDGVGNTVYNYTIPYHSK